MEQSVPVSLARDLSSEGACSLAVVVVRMAKDVEDMLSWNKGEGLNVALLDTPQQKTMFVKVCVEWVSWAWSCGYVGVWSLGLRKTGG